MPDNNFILAHTCWNCKYHIVFAPKYRRKFFYEEKRQEIGKILRKLCEFKNWIVNCNKPYFEKELSFTTKTATWKAIKFSSSGYKVIQNFSNDCNTTMRLCNSRGEIIAENKYEKGGLYNNGFISAYVNDFDLYLINFISPSYAFTDKLLKISIISADKLYNSINDVQNIAPDDFYDITCDLPQGGAMLALFTPDVTAHYLFNSDICANIEIYDTYSGERMTKFYKETEWYHDSIALLDENHEYLLLIHYEDFLNSSGQFQISMDFYEDDEIKNQSTPYEIKANNKNFQKKIDNLKNKTYVDYWFSFEESGWILFQLFGNVGNLNLEIYDIRSNLLESDNNENGTSCSSFICFEAEAGVPYRIRVRNNSSNNKGNSLVLNITPVENYYYHDSHNSFYDLFDLSWWSWWSEDSYNSNYFEQTISGYIYFRFGPETIVGYFVAPSNGYYTFSIEKRYDGPTPASLYVIDTNSFDYAQYGKDYIVDDGYEPDNNSITKELVKGRRYFLICPGYGNYDLHITEQGRKLGNANENGGFSNSFTISSQSSERFKGIYIPNKTAYVCFDASEKNSNLANDVSVKITDTAGNSVNEDSRKAVNGKDVVVALLKESKPYVITITNNSYSSSSGTVYFTIYYQGSVEEFPVDSTFGRYVEKNMYIIWGSISRIFYYFQYKRL